MKAKFVISYHEHGCKWVEFSYPPRNKETPYMSEWSKMGRKETIEIEFEPKKGLSNKIAALQTLYDSNILKWYSGNEVVYGFIVKIVSIT